jgi:pimeloyl-ACP methyl ester carboxylesterase
MYVRIKGIDLWYDMTGCGPAVVLLHGNGESSKIFNVLTGQLKDRFTVYQLDSRCHGQSGNTDEISYELMMNDVVSFIRELKLEKPILYGFSDGGIVGLMIGAKYPGILSKLIISGANTHPCAIKTYWRLVFRCMYFFSRDKKISMMFHEPNITKEELKKISIPVLVLAGENDMIKEKDTRFIAENISGSTLHIIPGENHMSYVINSPKLYRYIEPFLT